jgi:pyridoxamine 5'-phosphate oxidase
MSTSDFERDHVGPGLLESDCADDAIEQFRRWYSRALDAGLPQPDAAALATAGADGRPSARMVLLRGYDSHGFVFFTNLESRKGRELAARPWAALLFYWPELDRQVRIEGRTERASDEESDAYFALRPWQSRVSAWASPQSQVLASRRELETRYQTLSEAYRERDVPRPPNWGGYRLVPDTLEFWQGRPHRLHDRIRYRLEGSAWRRERLAP